MAKSFIHHATVKRAATFGLKVEFSDTDGLYIVRDRNGAVVATSTVSAKAALEDAISSMQPSKPARSKKAKKSAKRSTRRANSEEDEEDEDSEEDEEDEEGDDDGEGKSVIKRKYKNRYRPHKMTCGDPLSQEIRSKFMTIKDPDTKKLKLDWPRFKKFAQNNGCWSPEYAHVNNGMKRMNIVNRLRAKVKAGEKVVWSV